MMNRLQLRRISSGWLATMLVAAIIAVAALSLAVFNQSFTSTVPVTLTSDRSGLVMEPYAKVTLRGIQVGRVASINSRTNATSLQLDLDPAQLKYIPANVEARIDATSLFGPKFVNLIVPKVPTPQRLAAGAILHSENVAVEVNTVFENVVDLIKQLDPHKLNAILSALAEGVRGQGEQIGVPPVPQLRPRVAGGPKVLVRGGRVC